MVFMIKKYSKMIAAGRRQSFLKAHPAPDVLSKN